MEEKRKITLRDILDLVDITQEGGQVLRIVGPDERYLDGVVCLSNSWILEHLLDYPVAEMNNDQNQTNVLVVVLMEREVYNEPEEAS